jgi:hypothetical protein
MTLMWVNNPNEQGKDRGPYPVGRARLAWVTHPARDPHDLLPAGSTFGPVPGGLAG